MRAEDIANRLKASPFVPFRIHFSDGTSVVVKHRDWVFQGRTRMELGTPVREGETIMDQIDYYAYEHMVRLEMLERQPSQSV